MTIFVIIFVSVILAKEFSAASSNHNSINKKGAAENVETLYQHLYTQNNNNNGGSGGLFPNVFNLATRAEITVNATCGERGVPEVYCKLVEHVQTRSPQCGTCDANSPDPERRHPIQHAIDGTPRWWQSPSLQYGPQYEWVTITLDLKQVYQVAYVIVKSAISPRPANWILERSVDGTTYRPWQYYAQSDEECWTRYGIPPTRGKPHYISDDEVICTSYYSKLNPLEGGEIHTSLVVGRPGSNESSATLRDFTLARYVRLRLQKIRTLNAEFMSPSIGTLDDTYVARRLFYSIKDISIGGQCVCSGHASHCPHNSKSGSLQCECQHNTCGSNCERCCPLYNLFPWRAGTPSDGAECEPCECHGHATSCRYDPEVEISRTSMDTHGQYRGGGVCNNCSKHTTGLNCERCEDGWYRPHGVSPRSIKPCEKCDCGDSPGATGRCAQDGNVQGKKAGTCECKQGYSGEKCEVCAPGFKGFPRCEACPCDPHGTADCEGKGCICKPHVTGSRCDSCIPGYFALHAGCLPCFCSGVATTCKAAKNLHKGKVGGTLMGWLVSDLAVSRTVQPTFDDEIGELVVGNYQLPGVESYFWLAPEVYLGNRLTSYGSNVKFSVGWIVMRGDTSGRPTLGPDAVLVGHNGVRLGSGSGWYKPSNVTLSIPLVEKSWYHIPADVIDIGGQEYHRGKPATRTDLLGVLSNVRHLLLRAKFHTDQIEGSLAEAWVEIGEKGGSGSPVELVEKCDCPPGYTGFSCELCDYGYTRVTLEGNAWECKRCNCNGHAPTCDPITGQCAHCEHNTNGTNCDTCLLGFYGDATKGTPEDCEPCACPLLEPSNNFSPKCELQPGSDDEYVCTSCPTGYDGDHCEKCVNGYFGSPTEPGSTCKPCECGDGPCDGVTGQCLQCRGNTEGWHCERCLPNHYGNPSQADCKACACNALGSRITDSCDEKTGQCDCHERFAGRACDRCESGYGNVSAGCVPCSCHPVGSLSEQCDPVTGQCPCQPGISGPRCDTCQEFHYGFSATGCKSCGCHTAGSESSACDIITGQCTCRPYVSGRACDICKDGFWGLNTSRGCVPCDCDRIGAINNFCDPHTGQCPCRPGVGGPRCDQCLPGYFGFSADGCSKCEQCDKPGHICDPDTGRCVCPPLTTGPTCDHCQPGSWGFEPGKGCKSCGCSTTGSLRAQCDFRTGRCFCREGFYGDRCSGCAPGHFGYPRCQPCDCHPAGTRCTSPETCKHQACDPNTGQCPCKANVIGRRCSQCKAGTFGLHQENQDGCTRCFCFGRTTACTEAGLTLSRILMPPPGTRTIIVEYGNDTPPQSSTGLYPIINTQKVYYANLILPGKGEIAVNIGPLGQLNATNTLQLIPGDVGDVHVGVSFPFEVPVYWNLPRTFLGDRVLSYGGFLRFRVESEGGHTLLPSSILARYPLVQLQGNGRIVLEHYPILPSSTGYHQIRLHESLWRLKSPSLPGSGNKVTREMLMVALQNVQHILIRASESADFTRAVLRDVTLDTGVQLPGQPMPPYARGVELCDCPPQYNATSCQDPSIGFYRWYDNNSVSSTIVIQLVGEARPCHCNQRSRICDIETGYCLNCSDNTGGPHCEQCGEGYYGDPARGPCKPCPCPTVGRNFARSCRVTPKGHVHCFCKEGYTGKRCDRCSYGWFGFPKWEGGSCKPCLCNPYGSVSDECHEQTGQCNCRPGITGRDCSICSRDRFILTAQGCTSCDDECTGVLLNDLARLKIQLDEGAGHLAGGVVPPPWTQLEEVNITAIGLQKWLDLAGKVIALPTNTPEKLKRHAQQLLNKSEFVNGRCKKMADEGVSVLYESEKLNKEISDLKETIEDVVEGLKRYGQTTASSIVSVSQALREARRLLNKIKGRNLLPRHKAANRALKTCSELVKRIKELLDGIPELKDLREKLKDVAARLDDILDITTGVIQKTNKVADLTSSNQARLHAVQDKLKQVTTLESEQRAIYAMVEDSNEGSRQLLDIAFDNIEAFRELEANLTMLTRALEQKEGILARLNPIYKEKYVLKAQLHADMLRHQAQVYRDLFNATRRDADFALRASKAYQDIVDALEGARKAAMNASKAAEIAHKTAHPGFGRDSLVDKAVDSLNESKKLLDQAKQHTKRVRDLEGSLKQHEKDMDSVQSSLAQAASIDNSINIQLQKLEDKHGLHKVIEKAKNISKTMDRIAEEAAQVGSDVHNILRPRLEKLDTDLQVNTILTHIKTGQENVRQSEDLLSRISEEAVDKHRRFREWNDTLAARLQDLRNKILQAQHAANGIQLSITSRANASGSCVRSYRPSNLQPSTTTSIILDYALDSGNKHRDGVLLFLPSSTTDDFVAVEIVGYHIRFVWDLGGGPGQVQHPLKLQPSVSKEEKIWYRIEVDRTSNIAKLSVRPHKLPDGSPLASGTPVRNFTKAGFGQLDVGPGDLLWVGGLPPTSSPGPPLLKARDSVGLEGCLHQVILNGRAIGLWNFATQNPGGCGACVQSGEQTRDEHTFRFDGDGYAVLHRASSGPYNKYAFSVSLKFRTLDENAILFLAINPNSSDRFVSLTLRDGHVLFRVGYAGSSRLEMASLERHNTGNWTIVEASRLFDRRKKLEKGVLKVEGEARDGAPTPPPGQDALPDLSDALYFVGGVPPGALGNRPPSDLPGSFLGCLAEIQVAQDGYSPLRGQFYGVEAGCEDSMLRRASFRGRGHLELPSHTLKKVHGSFAFVFRTIQTNALLMLTAFRHTDGGEDPGSFYSASLVGGRVDVRVDAGRGGVTLSSPERYDDGQFHSLSVTKDRRRLELRVDDVVQDVATLPEGAAQVRAPGASGGLYFGGVPTNFHVTGLAGSSTPLIGTIKDAIFNDQLLDFDHPVSFRHVGIGRLDPINVGKTPSLSAATPSILPQPSEVNGNTEGPHECHKGNSYSLEPGAAKFGDSPHSHVLIRRRSPVLPKGDFTVELDFRTFYPNGLLFIVPGFKGKQFHYILLQLRNKHLLLTIVWGQRKKGNTGPRKVELEAPQDLNDGNWHRVLVARESNKIVMVVDVPGKKRLRKRYPKKLFIGNTMYVGGLPEEDGTTLSEMFIKPEGLKGCLRGLAINQQSQNLVGHRVGQCFPLVEQASYFPGDAYAVYKEEFTVGSLLELQLEFRTSEHTGVLLSVSEPEGYPALSLEINNGKVVMTGDMGDRQPFRVEQSFPSRFTVCDNRWHRVKAFFVNDELTLKVDHLASMYGHSGNGQFSEASTKSPLYIGGLPEGAPSGTLGTRDNFKGCIRNVVIDGKLWDWTDMAYLHNILLSSCPVSS